MPSVFDRVACVTLKRRPDRWERFLDGLPLDWPFEVPEKIIAVDGKLCPPPFWWGEGPGAWGCYRSHLRIIEETLNRGLNSVLLLEDDAIFKDDFAANWRKFYEHLPTDWGMIYLGGQHLSAGQRLPIKVNEYVYRPYNVNRTHAWAIRGREMLRVVYKHLNQTKTWHGSHHIDHHLGRLHMKQADPIYTPKRWMVGQRDGKSNVSGREIRARFFRDSVACVKPVTPFVAVIGLHRSGSSCTAGVLHKLGIHMGPRLVGYEKGHGGGFESAGLMALCEKYMPFPTFPGNPHQQTVKKQLRNWLINRTAEAKDLNTVAGGKYPHLCCMGNLLTAICQKSLKVIHIDRRLEDSIRSLKQREPHLDTRKLQEYLWAEKLKFLNTGVSHLTVAFYDLLENPAREIQRIVKYLGIAPTDVQIQDAIAHVNPNYLTQKKVSIAY